MAEMAEEYPDVIFLHCSGYLNNDTNFANYFGKMYQPRYLSGLAAGAMTDSNKIGYVAAFPIPEVIRGINAFAAGVNEVNPDATVEVVWTFTWFGPEAETQAANALLEKGADVLAQHQDSTATGLAAEAAGEPIIIPHDTAVKTREFIANDIAAWASFQPAFDMIVKKEPDLLD